MLGPKTRQATPKGSAKTSTMTVMQAAWKVGGFVIVFAALLVFAYALLERSFFKKPADVYYASFSDAGGVATGSAVLLSGVKVGQVEKVELVTPNEAKMTLTIDKGTQIPIGSVVVVPASFISIGDVRLLIVPPPKSTAFLVPGDTLSGKLGTPLEGILPDTSKTMLEVNKTLVALQDLLSDKGLKKQLSDLMVTVTDTSKKFGGVATRVDGLIAQNQNKFGSLLTTTGQALKDMQAVSAEVRKLVASGELQGKTTALLDNLNAAVIQGKTLVADMQGFVNDPEMRDSLKGTMANFKIMSESGTKIAADAEIMAANGVEISAETKALMVKANKLAEQVSELVDKFNKTVDKFSGPAKSITTGIEVETTLAHESGPGHIRTDANVFFPVGKKKVMVGLWDAFESNKINLQLVQPVNDKLGLRYGAYASKPGIGVDYDLASRLGLRGDLFGLNDPRLDLRLGYKFDSGVMGWAGLNNVFGRNTPSIGVTVRK